MTLNPNLNNREQDKFKDVGGLTAVRVSVAEDTSGGGGGGGSSLVTAPLVENVTIAIADTEQTHTFPADTKRFLIQSRGSKVKLSFASGQSGTTYLTVHPYGFYSEDGIGAASLTVYLQSPAAGSVVELVSWS